MKIFRKIGIGLILLGVALLFVGLHFFTYRGNLSRVISDMGKFSFLLCLPTIVAGIILVVGFGKKHK